MQVYAVYYEQSGRFLLGYKLEKGYYFYNSSTRTGSIVPTGQKLNRGNNYALPGGKLEGAESIVDAASREFTEETGVLIVKQKTDINKFSNDYTAVFFCIDNKNFNDTATEIIKNNLPNGLKAKDDIINKKITNYQDIFKRYPNAPKDNERMALRKALSYAP